MLGGKYPAVPLRLSPLTIIPSVPAGVVTANVHNSVIFLPP